MCIHDEVMCRHGEVIYATIKRDEVIWIAESRYAEMLGTGLFPTKLPTANQSTSYHNHHHNHHHNYNQYSSRCAPSARTQALTLNEAFEYSD